MRRILAVLCLSGLVGLAGFAWRYATQPVVLTIAVGPPGFDDAELAAALAQALGAARSSVRLSIQSTTGQQESLEMLKDGKVQLAIFRNEGDAPDNARAVALLHNDPVIVMAPKSANITEFYQLANKTIGLVAAPGAGKAPGGVYKTLMDQLRTHYQGKFATIAVSPVAADIAAALGAGKFDALLFVAPTTRSAAIAHNKALVRKMSGKSLAFISINDAEAIAAAAPVYEEGEVDEGAFGGKPLSPEENVTTLLVATYLVADENVRPQSITELTRFIFENRPRLVADAPVAALIKAASTDKDAALAVHEGAKVFYDGDEQTLFDQYGDWLYAGPMVLGALYSLLLAFRRMLGFGPTEEPQLLASVRETIEKIRKASSTEELDAISATVDVAVERISTEAVGGKLEEKSIGANSLVLRHIDLLLREKRAELKNGPPA